MRKITRPECPNPRALSKDYKNAENKKVLLSASNNKCMYCESYVTHISYGDVEHIRPKSRYPDLEFTWGNLGIVCSICNNTKSDKFDESTQYINPYQDDPEDHILASGALLLHKQGSERGQLTILEIGLNRVALIEKRFEKINRIQNAIDAAMRTPNNTLKQLAIIEILNESESNQEFSLCIKQLLKSHGIID